MDVRFDGPSEGDANDDDNGLDEVDAEMIELNLTGDSSLGPVVVTRNPDRPTLGQFEETDNNLRGVLDVPPPVRTTDLQGNERKTFQSGSFGTAIITSQELGLDGLPVPVDPRGPTTTLVRGKAGQTTGTWDTETISMSLIGDVTIPGGRTLNLMLRESPQLASQGVTQVREFDQGGSEFLVDSFFDVSIELSLGGGRTWMPAAESVRVEAAQTHLITAAGPATRTRLLRRERRRRRGKR